MQCLLRVGVLGISYKTADLAIREEIARGVFKISGERTVFFKHPVIPISTCNRTEIYFSGDDLSEVHSDLLAFFRSQVRGSFEHRLYSYFGIDCFVHLCRVIAGLDSAILAETEIQGQVKLAYYQSAQKLELPSCLHYMFQKGLRVGKIARNSLPLAKGSSTLYGTMFHLAQRHLGDLNAKQILIVGNSEINRGLISYLQKKSIRKIVLATRYPLGSFLEGVVIRDRDILSYWQEFDWIVCAAHAKGYLLSGNGRKNPLVFDLSVPRNVDPQICGVKLLNIEQVNQIVDQRRSARADALETCESLVLEKVRGFARSYRAKVSRRLQKII